jgi:hypothetical protein
VADYLDGGRWERIAEFIEVESGKRAIGQSCETRCTAPR